MTLFRFVGEIHFLDRAVPVDLYFDTNRLELADVLADLLGRPDDLKTPVEVIALETTGSLLPSPQRRETEVDLLDALDRETSDARKWGMLAGRFPDLFSDEGQPAALPGLATPPKNLKDIQRMLRQEEAEPERNLEADLESLRAVPRKQLTFANGTVNKSAVARALGRSTGGGGWGYIDEMVAHLQGEYDEADIAAGFDDEAAIEEAA